MAFVAGYPLFGWDRDRPDPQPLSEVNESYEYYLVTAKYVIDGLEAAKASSVEVVVRFLSGDTDRITFDLAEL